MKRFLVLLMVILGMLAAGCSHQLTITNLNEHYSTPPAPPQEPVSVGLVSGQMSDPVNNKYVYAIVTAMRNSGNFDRVIYPYSHAEHSGVASVVHLSVLPSYDGMGSNFFVNFPGFLIFAPAIWGYGYEADIDTMADISYPGANTTKHLEIPTRYDFRQAEIDRTWTEVGWLEVGIIPFIGGFVFTQYDPDVTRPFISEVSSNYGYYVGSKITRAVYASLSEKQ